MLSVENRYPKILTDSSDRKKNLFSIEWTLIHNYTWTDESSVTYLVSLSKFMIRYLKSSEVVIPPPQKEEIYHSERLLGFLLVSNRIYDPHRP